MADPQKSKEDLAEYYSTIEALRRHEDGVMAARTSIFLVASGILSAGFALGNVEGMAFACLGIVLACFWLYLGLRQLALIAWYDRKLDGKNGEQPDGCDSGSENEPAVVTIHRELKKWKKDGYEVGKLARVLRRDGRFHATDVMCVAVPLTFVGFWAYWLYHEIWPCCGRS